MERNNMALDCPKIDVQILSMHLCITFRAILVFHVSQGSAATFVRGGGNDPIALVENVRLLPKVKEF
jgi:hypothetical protein